MRVLPTELPGVLLVEPTVLSDARGFFVESWQRDRFAEVTRPDRRQEHRIRCRGTHRRARAREREHRACGDHEVALVRAQDRYACGSAHGACGSGHPRGIITLLARASEPCHYRR